MELNPYARLSMEGEKNTKGICGCFETVDGFFKFCSKHQSTLKKAIESQIDEPHMPIVIDEKVLT